MATSETTSSTTYADLATVGPSLTASISATGSAMVTVTATVSNSKNNRYCLMSFAAGGVPASDARALSVFLFSAGDTMSLSATYYVTGLTPGSNTFTAKYKASGNTCTFLNRNIIVVPTP